MKGAKKPKKGLTIVAEQGETDEHAIARTMLNPALQSAGTIQQYSNSPVDLDLDALIDCLEKQNENVADCNLERVERMLLSQATTLDAIANNLFRRAKVQDYMSQLETFMKLGLKAQNQCRTTLEALLRAKNPKTHLKQTNVSLGHQQVNNFPKKVDGENELLEETDERLDERTTQEAVSGDQTLETVGAKHRPKNA